MHESDKGYATCQAIASSRTTALGRQAGGTLGDLRASLLQLTMLEV
jgi:hypothetical protein